MAAAAMPEIIYIKKTELQFENKIDTIYKEI
jgi:hypothetical protein